MQAPTTPVIRPGPSELVRQFNRFSNTIFSASFASMLR
jgi:hypothetical protein